MAADVSSYSCSSLRSQEDPCPTRHPAIRSLKTSRRDEISEGFDSLSGLLSDLRSAQDDAQQEVTRALQERDRLLSCLQSKERNDDRMNDFLSQLGVAESRCTNLTDQLDYMKKMYTSSGGGCRRASPCTGRARGTSRGRSPAGSSPGRTRQCVVQRRRSLSNSLPPGRSPIRCGRQNASSPSLRTNNPCTTRSPGRKPPCRGGAGGVRLGSLLPRMAGGRRGCDDTDADGDHLWCDARRRHRSPSRSRCGGILANASKYVPGSMAELQRRSRAASLASRNTSVSPGRSRCGPHQSRRAGVAYSRPPPPRPRRAASESLGRRYGADSGIDSDSESPTRLAARHALMQKRANERARASTGRAPLPFLSSSNSNKSHHIGANIQNVMSMAKHSGACSRFRAPLPDIKVGRLPQRGPFIRFKRRKPFKYHDKLDIAKYKIEVDPRSCGPDNTADFALYRRDTTGCSDRGSAAPPPRRYTRQNFNPVPSLKCGDDGASTASATVQRMLGNPATLRRTKRSLKQLLEELAEEFAGLECVCQRLETDMSRDDGTVDRRQLEEQIGRLECMMEERRRQVCCLLKLYKQIKKLSRSSGQDGCRRPRRSILRAGRFAGRVGRPMRVNTRIQPNSLRPRGVTFSMQKSFPLRPVQPRYGCGTGGRRARPAAGGRVSAPLHGVELKVLQDMRNIQRRMRIDMGDEY